MVGDLDLNPMGLKLALESLYSLCSPSEVV